MCKLQLIWLIILIYHQYINIYIALKQQVTYRW